MMKNTKVSVSKTRQRSQQKSPRSPLKAKDVNTSSSSCSSSFSSSTTATSISSEAPKGCLRFFLSNHSSTVSKNGSNRKPKSFIAINTPKSAPNIKRFRGKSSGNNGKNPEKPISRNVHKLKKNPPPPWKSGRNPSSRSDFSDDFVKLCDSSANFTPVNKVGRGFVLGNSNSYNKAVRLGEKDTSSDTSSPIPPVQASVSPEIQGGSTSVVKATPITCYAAGHVLSGVSDKRKCRARGLLTIGDNDLFGSSKAKVFRIDDEDVVGSVNKPGLSLMPSPTEASMHWNLSPCDERSADKNDDSGNSGVRLNECGMSMPSKSIGCLSSPSSSLGFSSELCNKSDSTMTTSDATTVSHSSRSQSSGFRSLLGPSFDHLVRSYSPTSPFYVSSSKVEVSPEEEIYTLDRQRESTPCSVNSIGSGNVIQTPQSDSSPQNFELSHLSRDEISRLWFESELDSVAEVLRRVSLSPECETPMVSSPRMSFEFNPLIKADKSIDFSIFRKAMDSQTSPGVPEPLLHSYPESEVRISWREGLASRIFEMDELDCCRCLSDEEDDVNGCSNPGESSLCSEVVDIDSNRITDDACDPTRSVHHEDSISRKDVEGSTCMGTSPCLELRNGGGSSGTSENFKVCYENLLFQV